jgi:hypothetical protein
MTDALWMKETLPMPAYLVALTNIVNSFFYPDNQHQVILGILFINHPSAFLTFVKIFSENRTN